MRLRLLLTGTLLTAGAFAQMSSFPKPNYFRETFQKARTTVELRDPSKLRDYVADGKLELSLKHYLELVMANNTDIQLQFLTIEQPKNAIQSAMGVWDPTGNARFTTTRSTSLPTSPLDTSNVNSVLKSLNQPLSMTYNQLLDTGTQISTTFGETKTSSSNSRSSYVKQYNTNLNVNIQQPLLRNRGRYVNRLPLMSAQSNLKVSQFNLRNQLLNLVNTAENAYWSVVSARETVRVQEQAVETAKKNLAFTQQQLDLGAISKLDIYNPQSAAAAAEVNLSQAKFNLRNAEDNLRHQLGVDLDPQIRLLPVVLTEPVDPGADLKTVDREAAIQTALNNNPALKAALQRLDVDDLQIYSAKNSLLPNLTFGATYTTNGLGGVFDPNRTSLFGGGSAALLPLIPGGVTDALSQMFGFGYPTYQASLTLQLPIRSRAASATMANAVVQKKQDALTVRNQQQNVRLQVLNAVTSLEGAREQLKLAITQRDFALLNEQAEEEKYRLGTDINQNVVLAQQALAQAELTVVNAQISVRRQQLNLLTQTGELLDQRGIVVK